MIQRGLAVGLSLAAPPFVLTAILGWPYRATTVLIAGLVMLYTVTGGVKALNLDRRPADGGHFLRASRGFGHGRLAAPGRTSRFWMPFSLAGAAGKA